MEGGGGGLWGGGGEWGLFIGCIFFQVGGPITAGLISGRGAGGVIG